MTQENTTNNTKPKYSEMLMQVVQQFNEQLPSELTLEDTLEIGIDAWNLSNSKTFLEDRKLYKQELENRKYAAITDKMVTYKQEKFPEHNRIIIDYSTENNVLKVKTMTQEDRFSSMIKQMVTSNKG